jgi:hypothetical protein
MKLIPDFPDYAVTEDGRVWRVTPPRRGPTAKRPVPYEIQPVPTRGGYRNVSLVPPGGGTPMTIRVHRLVLTAFKGGKGGEEYLECRHLNGDPSDNRLSNLQWGTRIENAADRDSHGRTPKGETHCHARLSARQVEEIRVRLAFGESGSTLARDYGVCASTISSIKNRRNWRVKSNTTTGDNDHDVGNDRSRCGT